MKGTEFADKLKTCAIKELRRWDVERLRSLLANDDALSTVANALQYSVKNPRKFIYDLTAEKFKSGTIVCCMRGPVPDNRVAKTRGSKMLLVVYLNHDKSPELEVTLEPTGYYHYYTDRVPVSKIKDVHKFVHDFIDSQFKESGIAEWEDDYVSKKLQEINNYCDKHGITVTGSLGFSRKK